MNTKFSFIIAAIALCTFAACSNDSSSPASPADNGNSATSSSSSSLVVDDISSSSSLPTSSSENPSESSSSSVSSQSSSSVENSCTQDLMDVKEMKSLFEKFSFPTTTTGAETIDEKTPMYKVSHNEFSVAACDTTYPAIMQAADWTEEASLTVGSGNFISFVGYRYTKKISCSSEISIAFICRDGMETGTTNFYVEYLNNARKEHLSVGTYE